MLAALCSTGRKPQPKNTMTSLIITRLIYCNFWCSDISCVQMSRVVRKLAFCICENKDADQLRGNREADQRLCFRYIDSIIPLLPKSEISSLQPSSMVVQPGLCRTWSETPKTGFLTTRLKYIVSRFYHYFCYLSDIGPDVMKPSSCSVEHEINPAYKCQNVNNGAG